LTVFNQDCRKHFYDIFIAKDILQTKGSAIMI